MKLTTEELKKIIKEELAEQVGQQEDEATLWKYLLWALTSTTKDPSRTIKELMKKGLRLSDSSSVDSVAGTDVKAAIIEHMKLWQKLQTSKQKLAVSLKLLAKGKATGKAPAKKAPRMSSQRDSVLDADPDQRW